MTSFCSKAIILNRPRFAGMLSPRRKMVAETPCHKQVSQVLRRTPGKLKTQSSAVDEADDVVEESPEKQVKGFKFLTVKHSHVEMPSNCWKHSKTQITNASKI